jgi:hypothetical protein
VDLVAALFTEHIDFRQIPGPSTRIDLTGVYFSVPVSSFPTVVDPHLVVLVRCAADHHGTGILLVEFRRSGVDGEEGEVARSRQVFSVDPGKFGYRLVRAELPFDEPGTIEAHVHIDGSPTTLIVPLTALQSAVAAAPVSGGAGWQAQGDANTQQAQQQQ